MYMDKISVITTFYNAEQFILNAVNSVAVQKIDKTFTLEYVIVDDKSKDNSRYLIEQYIKTSDADIDWHLIEPDENLGCGGARRYGIEHATGDYFMFLDADDYYMHTDFISRAYNDIKAERADIIEYGMVYNQADGRQFNSVAPNKIVIDTPHQAELALYKDNLIKFNVWTKIYKRSIVESYRYSDTRTFEDVRTIPIWIANAKKIVVMPTLEINYRAATGSIIRSDMVQTRLGTISAIASHFERFKDDYEVLKAMYGRAMIDLEAMLHNHSSNNEGFNEMSRLNTYMLKYLYPDTYQTITYHIEDTPQESN